MIVKINNRNGIRKAIAETYCGVPLPSCCDCLTFEIVPTFQTLLRSPHQSPVSHVNAPGKRKNEGFISARACKSLAYEKRLVKQSLAFAISSRIPLGLFLKVGGKRESIAKLMDSPVAPSRVITHRFEVELGEVLDWSCTVTCSQDV